MGAEIVWRDGPHGVIRFGPEFKSSEDEDDFAGSGYVRPHDDDPTAICVIGPVSGEEMSRRDHDNILEQCAARGFRRARVRRRKRWYWYDLTVKPYSRRPA